MYRFIYIVGIKGTAMKHQDNYKKIQEKSKFLRRYVDLILKENKNLEFNKDLAIAHTNNENSI